MTDMFANVPADKREPILMAAVNEFAQKGYENASTNTITQEAGISKGLLFHYFGNKKRLFLAVLDYSLKQLYGSFDRQTETVSRDLFERMLEWSQAKMTMFYENPHLYRLAAEAFLNPPDELKEEMARRYQETMSAYMPQLLADVDYSCFRDDMDQQKALELIMFCLDGLENKYQRLYKHRLDQGLADIPELLEEMKAYLKILKFGICKQA